jgi:hypothetical protein
MTIDELEAAVCEANRAGEWPALVERLRRLDAEELFRLLFPLATSAQRVCPLAYSAALLLYQIKPISPLPCREAVRGLLGGWDISIEEVPWYLDEVYGRNRVLKAIAELMEESLTESEKVNLRTIAYWLDVPESERSMFTGL